jgi:hypothetical protein
MAVCDDERCLEVGFLAGIEGRELAPVVASMCEPYDKSIRDLNERIRLEEDDPKLSAECLGRLQSLVDEESRVLSSFLGRFQEARIPSDRLRDGSDGEWILAALVGLLLPAAVAGVQHDDLANTSRWLLVVVVAMAARWSAPHLVPSSVLAKLSDTNTTVSVIVAIEVACALLVPRLAALWLTVDLAASAWLAGSALAMRANRHAMREPVISDLRRALHHTRDRAQRIESERQRRIDGFLRTQQALQAEVYALMSDKQMAQRRVTEGFHLGVGLAASRYRTASPSHRKAN